MPEQIRNSFDADAAFEPCGRSLMMQRMGAHVGTKSGGPCHQCYTQAQQQDRMARRKAIKKEQARRNHPGRKDRHEPREFVYVYVGE